MKLHFSLKVLDSPAGVILYCKPCREQIFLTAIWSLLPMSSYFSSAFLNLGSSSLFLSINITTQFLMSRIRETLVLLRVSNTDPLKDPNSNKLPFFFARSRSSDCERPMFRRDYQCHVLMLLTLRKQYLFSYQEFKRFKVATPFKGDV